MKGLILSQENDASTCLKTSDGKCKEFSLQSPLCYANSTISECTGSKEDIKLKYCLASQTISGEGAPIHFVMPLASGS